MKFAVLPKPDLILAAYFLQRVAYLIIIIILIESHNYPYRSITVVSNKWFYDPDICDKNSASIFAFWAVLLGLSGTAAKVTADKSSTDKFLHGFYTFVASFMMNLCADGFGKVTIFCSSVSHSSNSINGSTYSYNDMQNSYTNGTIFPMLLLTLACLVYVFKKSPEKDSDLIIWPTPVLIYFGVCSHLFVYKCVEAIDSYFKAAGAWIILVLISVVLTGIGAWKEGHRSGIKIVFTLVGSFFLNGMIGGLGYLAVISAMDGWLWREKYYVYGSMIVVVLAPLILIFRFIKTKLEPQPHLILQNPQPNGATPISPVTNAIQENIHPGPNNPQMQGYNQPSNPQTQGYNQPSNPQMLGHNQPSNPQMQGYDQPGNPQMHGYNQPSNPQMQGYNQPSNPQMQGYNQPSNLQTQGYNQPSNPQMLGCNQPGPSNPQIQGYNQHSNPQMQGYNQPSNLQMLGHNQPESSNPQIQGYNQPGPSNPQTQRYGQAGPLNFPMQEFRSTTVDSVNDPTSKETKEFLSQVQNTVSAEPSCPPQESSQIQTTDQSLHLYNEPPPSYSSVTGQHGNKLN